MSNHINNIQQAPTPSNQRAAYVAASCAQSLLIGSRQCVTMVDRCLARAPGGTTGMLDGICAMTNGANVVQEFYDIYVKALEIANAFKVDDADPNLLEQFTQADVTAAIGRM